MTNEEAKYRLLEIERCTPIHTREDARDFEALEMAIKALSQEPCEKCEVGNPCLYCEYEFSRKIEPMRDFTEEEAKAYSKALDKMCKPTGFNVFDEPCDDAISREAVIEILENYGCTNREGLIFKDIQALPSVMQKSTECDDAISREDRLVDLANAIENDDSGYWTNKKISSALRNIEQLPPVAQKMGRWLPRNAFLVPYKCSECNYESERYFNFCPNCGAKMQESEKE